MSARPPYATRGSWLLAPALAFWSVFLVAPMLIIFAYSIRSNGAWTLANYARAFDPIYGRILLRSAILAFVTTLLSVLVAYPAAWALRSASRSWQLILVALVAVPSWMNLLVKNYAWIVLLRREGVINTILQASGVIHDPLPLLFNQGAVLTGLFHTYLPFMILPLYAALERIDERLIEAARDLGADALTTFRRVVLPQTTRALVIGCILVFTAALGAFVTPDLLGGHSALMVASVIESQVLQVRDWNFAAALASLLLLCAGVCVLLYRWLLAGPEEAV